MDTMVDVTKRPLGLSSAWQKVLVSVWAVVLLFSLISFVSSVVSTNIWDRVPAASLPAYFHDMTQDDVTMKAGFQDETIRMGFSLAGFAALFTISRLIGGIPLFVLSAAIVRRYPRHLLAVLFAILLAVMGAGGMWNNTLYGAASALLPWMQVPTQVLNVLLWFGLILLYVFPNGRFTPRWTLALVILLVPIVIAMVFDLPIFLNANTWPEPLPLLPSLVFIGLAFFSVLFRYTHTADPVKKNSLRGFTLGVSLLMILYFILFFLIDVYGAVTGAPLFSSTMRAGLSYALVSEPVWFGLQLVFALLAARSIFRERLFES